MLTNFKPLLNRWENCEFKVNVKKRKVIDAGGVEHVMLIPENERDNQIVQGYSVRGIGHPDKRA
jgi:hypothetical protein